MRKMRRGGRTRDAPKKAASRPKYYGAYGKRFDMRVAETATSHDLPPVPKRWGAHRKAEIIAAVSRGIISLDDALQRYALTVEEFLTWQRSIRLFGLSGLNVSKIQKHRITYEQSEDGPSTEDGSGVRSRSKPT